MNTKLNIVSIAIIVVISTIWASKMSPETQSQFYHEIPLLKGKVINGYSDYQAIKNVDGLIVLVDGYSNKQFPYDEAVKYLCKWTKIPELASMQKWATIIIPYGENLYMNDSLYDAFQICINDAIRKYKVETGRYIIGGLSAGGAMAVSFTEAVIRDKKKDLIPKAVFAVDPVLDLVDLYNSSEREMKRTCKVPGAGITNAKSEAKSVIQLLDSNLGNPIDSLHNYTTYSPYTMSREDGGNSQYLYSMPIRVYHELDPMWSMKERCRSINDENGIVGCNLIYNLYMAGNINAEVILTQNRGYRLDGTRHPHSWNIVEEEDFIMWAKKCFAGTSKQ